MTSEVLAIPTNSFVLLMTMGHATDSPILLEILRHHPHLPFLGVIGSKAKAARLRKDIAEAGLPEDSQHSFHCPIGLEIGTNDPAEIAVSVAAQLIQQRDRKHQVIRPSV